VGQCPLGAVASEERTAVLGVAVYEPGAGEVMDAETGKRMGQVSGEVDQLVGEARLAEAARAFADGAVIHSEEVRTARRAAAPRIEDRPGRPERVHRATSADGTEIAGEAYGQGPPLVLVHAGLGHGTLDWAFALPSLSDRFTCYCHEHARAWPERRSCGPIDATLCGGRRGLCAICPPDAPAVR